MEKVMNGLFFKRWLIALAMIAVACEEAGVKPVLPNADEFLAPAFISPATTPAKVLLPENAGTVYETFIWTNANYGINVSIRYELEISAEEDFDEGATRVLIVTEGALQNNSRWVSVTVKQLNDAMLALGLPGFQQSTVYIRIKSTINGVENEPLYSGSITRIATTYRTSECGNFCSVGIIGDASPGGWTEDTDMRLLDPTGVDKYTWTVTVYLIGGKEVKFRAMDAWDTNWGSGDFPSGTGVQNGPNIPIPASGYYKVILNDQTGAYSFNAVSGTYTQIGIIGEGVGGWGDADEKFLTQSVSDPHVWTGTFTFTAADVKFRANASWSTNWGSDTYPSGYGVGNGPNIPVAVGGTYFVYFNDASGEYFFGPVANSTPYTHVGLIGPATPNGWGGPDLDLYKNPSNAYKWSRVVTLNDGELKIRADDDWSVNWGASTFPGGTGVQNGANIPGQAGTYFVRFNSLTGEYYFLK